MTVAESPAVRNETADVIRWRFSQLTRSGYEIEDATILATHLDVDLHQAADLVARKCPPALALEILL
jgi:hypothetical protein